MKLKLNSEEAKILRIWGQNTISGGHWGDGNFMLGEESTLMDKIAGFTEGRIDISPLELRVMQFWMEENRKGIGKTGSPAAQSLVKKISELSE